MVRQLLTAAALLATTMTVAMRTRSPRVDGEYGLWVEDRRDSLVVHWITRPAAAGQLRVVPQSGNALTLQTQTGETHRAALRRPRGREVTLIYGSSALDTTVLSLERRARAPVVSGADSIFIFGDTHGEFDAVLRVLRANRLIDDKHAWSGGKNHLVFVGDLMDRGEDVIRLLWFVYGLELQAARAGGRVHVVLGNHETMVWQSDLRYVAPKELAIAHAYGVPYDQLFDIRESVLGKWLGTKPAVLRIDDVLFAHGGVSTGYRAYNPSMFDDSLAKFLSEDLFYRFRDTTLVVRIDSAGFLRRDAFLNDARSVFWFRGYAQTDSLAPALDTILRRFGANLHVIAHTPSSTVHEKYNHKLIVAHPRTPGIQMVLLVRNGRDYQRFRLDHTGDRIVLPSAN